MSKKLLFLDTETTGNMPEKDRLCSVAYQVDDGPVIHELFKPNLPISVDAQAVHHITNEVVEDKGAFKDSATYNELEKLLPESIFIAHNAPFDIAMIEAEGLKVENFIDTLKVARALDEDGTIPRHGLQYLRYYLKLNVEDASAHSADGDVKVLAALFARLADKMDLEKMQEVSLQPSLLHRIGFGKHRGKRFDEIVLQDRDYLEWLSKQSDLDEDLKYSLQFYLHQK